MNKERARDIILELKEICNSTLTCSDCVFRTDTANMGFCGLIVGTPDNLSLSDFKNLKDEK